MDGPSDAPNARDGLDALDSTDAHDTDTLDELTDAGCAAPRRWVRMAARDCAFGPAIFAAVMRNLARNPNLNSSWLARADVAHRRLLAADQGGQGTERVEMATDQTAKPFGTNQHGNQERDTRPGTERPETERPEEKPETPSLSEPSEPPLETGPGIFSGRDPVSARNTERGRGTRFGTDQETIPVTPRVPSETSPGTSQGSPRTSQRTSPDTSTAGPETAPEPRPETRQINKETPATSTDIRPYTNPDTIKTQEPVAPDMQTSCAPQSPDIESDIPPVRPLPRFRGLAAREVLVRRLVPRNPRRDAPLDQTCVFYESSEALATETSDPPRTSGAPTPTRRSLVVYLPHAAAAADVPFYHPRVAGVAHLYTRAGGSGARLSVWYLPFEGEAVSARDARTAEGLATTVARHGRGCAGGYVKRHEHDALVSRAAGHAAYARLKARHARRLLGAWREKTDPVKHVFEDLAVAAFLVALWADMYRGRAFPGFVDVGCGNGLLVHVLRAEGYAGWGFDVRRRRSWDVWPCPPGALRQMVLVPGGIQGGRSDGQSNAQNGRQSRSRSRSRGRSKRRKDSQRRRRDRTGKDHDEQSPCRNGYKTAHQDEEHESSHKQNNEHSDVDKDEHDDEYNLEHPHENDEPEHDQDIPTFDGSFPPGTFIIANHADELTPWTPVLAALSDCPFLAIPCCSYGFGGRRARAPGPGSAYAALVEWVARVAGDCGWQAERDELRMPSTRRLAIVGRRRAGVFGPADAARVVARHGGAAGYGAAAARLAESARRPRCGRKAEGDG